jgi:Bax protein
MQQAEINSKTSTKVPEKKVEVKVPEKKVEVKVPEKKVEVKAPEKKVEKVKEFVLPDLNLKTETVLSLFEDVEYDLKKVRKDKLVKPIYFTQFPKDLDEISSVQLKKETFIKIVLPLVVAENQKILDDKYKLDKIISKKNTNDKEKFWIRQKLKEYKITNGNMDELMKRMDIIPVSIAIAQAAKESGWGTSRFALEGNAIFGQWTWNGRGIAPLDRAKNKNHKILRFPILRASVKAYKNNLNTHKSYKEFREVRSKLRGKRRLVTGKKLIHTLDNYAETGAEYTKILKQMIDQNSLEEFENVKLTTYVVKKELNL